MPERIQLLRRAGWRMPPNTLKVDRSTRWGNPLKVAEGYTAAQAVADYRLWLDGALPHLAATIGLPPSGADIRRHLRQRNLACWCRVGAPCHADVLLQIANAE
jgi:hypothetical protein